MSTSTPTSASNLFSSLPPPPKFTSCPILCHGETPKPSNFAQVDSLISQIFALVAPRSLLNSIILGSRDIEVAGQAFLKNSSLASPNSEKSIQARKTFLQVIKTTLYATRSTAQNRDLRDRTMSHFATELAPFVMRWDVITLLGSTNICRCTISSSIDEFIEFEYLNRVGGLNLSRASSIVAQIVFEAPFTTREGGEAAYRKYLTFAPIIDPLTQEILEMIETYLKSSASTPLTQAFELMYHLGGMKLLLYSNLLYSNLQVRNKIDGDRFMPWNGIMNLLNSERWKEEGGVELLEKMKIEADTAASLKQYSSAIETYSIISTLIPSVNALANGAALRLRVANDTDTTQFQLVIIDCTYALELEPNHVKALFRRGLAHCKLEMWNEGIADFQRAVELDSRSPAKQELEFALRQVEKRMRA